MRQLRSSVCSSAVSQRRARISSTTSSQRRRCRYLPQCDAVALDSMATAAGAWTGGRRGRHAVGRQPLPASAPPKCSRSVARTVPRCRRVAEAVLCLLERASGASVTQVTRMLPGGLWVVGVYAYGTASGVFATRAVSDLLRLHVPWELAISGSAAALLCTLRVRAARCGREQ